MNPFHDLVGYAAATLTTLAFIPQTLHRAMMARAPCIQFADLFSASLAVGVVMQRIKAELDRMMPRYGA